MRLRSTISARARDLVGSRLGLKTVGPKLMQRALQRLPARYHIPHRVATLLASAG
jgi:hypothetical protein